MERDMTREQIQEFSLRISQCSRTELVVITDEIIITYIEEARKALKNKDRKDFLFQLKKARQFVDELCGALDMRFELSSQLMNLYSYVRNCLIKAGIRNTEENLADAVKVMQRLRSAFSEVAKTDHSGKVIENSQKVYAGLTYGPGSKLNEVVL